MDIYIGIYDPNPIYARRLVSGLLKNAGIHAQTVEFTRPENVLAFAESKPLELLLIAKEEYREDFRIKNIGRIITLSSEFVSEQQKAEAADEGIGVLFKYQPLSVLSREIMAGYRRGGASEIYMEKQIIGVYSPVHRCGRTLLAVAIADIMGETRPALLMSFEEYSHLRDYVDVSSGDMMDAMYHFLQGELIDREKTLVRQLRHFDMLLPATSGEDIRGLKADEVTGFLKYFLNESIYSCIVVDLGDSLSEVGGILASCTDIYMPVLENEKARLDRFYEHLTRTGGGLSDRITEVSPPQISWPQGEFALPSEYMSYVRELIAHGRGKAGTT